MLVGPHAFGGLQVKFQGYQGGTLFSFLIFDQQERTCTFLPTDEESSMNSKTFNFDMPMNLHIDID